MYDTISGFLKLAYTFYSKVAFLKMNLLVVKLSNSRGKFDRTWHTPEIGADNLT